MAVFGRLGTALAAGLVSIAFGSVVAVAQSQLSDKATETIMNYAWKMTPEKFTKPDGNSIIIDKTKKDEIVVPVRKAREIIMIGRLNALAQMCDLPEAQVQSYQALMRREARSGQWSEQQLTYINLLHLTTVMLMVGRIEVVEKKEGKETVVRKEDKDKRTCSAEEREQVKNRIIEFLKKEDAATATKKNG